MPNFCAVLGCGSNSSRDRVSFFRFPSIYDFRKRIDLRKQKRREAWIAATRRSDLTESKLKYGLICGKHFLEGKPAKLEDQDHPDWIPTLKMGYESTKVNCGIYTKKRKIVVKTEVPDNTEANGEEIEGVFLNEESVSPIDAASSSSSFDDGLEPMQTSEITNNDRQSEKNRTFVEHIYQVLMELPPSKANQVRHKIYNILFQAEEENETFANQIGSSSNTIDSEVEIKHENL